MITCRTDPSPIASTRCYLNPINTNTTPRIPPAIRTFMQGLRAAGFLRMAGESDSYSGGDEAGKTLAIIIGLFAGVALLILFLTYLRKSCSHDGKGCDHGDRL